MGGAVEGATLSAVVLTLSLLGVDLGQFFPCSRICPLQACIFFLHILPCWLSHVCHFLCLSSGHYTMSFILVAYVTRLSYFFQHKEPVFLLRIVAKFSRETQLLSITIQPQLFFRKAIAIMRFVIVAALAFVSSAVAQTRDDVPVCARGCIETSTRKVTNCNFNDIKCCCKKENQDKILNDSLKCVVDSCGLDVAISK